ncbi:MAG: DUF1761 domain-containing protein [Saprospiraceae bacterium]
MTVNPWAVLVAALVPAIVGFLWYNPKLFGNAWMKSAGLTEEKMKSANMTVIFGVSFLMSLMLAYIMNEIACHDGFVSGALYYVTDGTLIPDPASEAGKWLEYYWTLDGFPGPTLTKDRGERISG